MKRIILLVILCCLFFQGMAQNEYYPKYYLRSRIGLFGGAGLATAHNYDVGISAGLDYDKSVSNRTMFGVTVFMQGFSLYYDNEANSAKHGLGYSGFTLRHDSKYVFFAPQIKYMLATKVNFVTWISVNAGVGMKMSGYDSVRKWNHSFDSTNTAHYDSTLDASKNLNSMVFRFGVAFTQDLYLGRGDWWFTFKEDFGMLGGSLTKTGDINTQNPGRNPYSPQRVSPGYVSLQIGISYLKTKHKN
jgi:hypothetical protein